MSDVDRPDVERPGIDRRTLIKRAAVTGAVAWTAPVIIESLASPAAAITCATTCFRVQFPGNASCLSQSSQTFGSTQQPPCTDLTGSGCTTHTSVANNTTYSQVCMCASGCTAECSTTNSVTFTLDASCTWGGGGTCNAPRRFLNAQARTTGGAPDPDCRTVSNGGASIAGTGTSVTFTKASGTWAWFQFVIGCSCT
jgi:hypothetical protein